MKNKRMEAKFFLQELKESKKKGMKIYFILEEDSLKTLALFDKDLIDYELDETNKHRNMFPSKDEIHEYCFLKEKRVEL